MYRPRTGDLYFFPYLTGQGRCCPAARLSRDSEALFPKTDTGSRHRRTMNIERLDHFVVTARDLDATIAFYQRVLGMKHVLYDGQYHALHFGDQKINLHVQGKELEPRATAPVPGSVDVCFVSADPIDLVQKHLEACDVAIELGPGRQVGAVGEMTSVYFRDPDGNLIEVASYR